MRTIRAYTTVEQSRKLAEIMPLESVDMWYSIVDNEAFICFEHHNEYEQIPCWSLAALLDNIPQVKIDNIKQYNKKHWRCCAYFASDWHDSGWYDNPVDACYEIILKLKELNLL